jgi:hypothetical protein
MPFGVDAVQAHCPDTQTSVRTAQLRPHPPQLLVSELVSTHAPVQLVKPWLHWQMPAEQLEPLAHLVPQAPQLALSVWKLTHVPVAVQRLGVVPLQIIWQPPATQLIPDAHALPQVPQLALLVVRSTQAFVQTVWPAVVQAAWQLPALQGSVPPVTAGQA